MKTTKFGEIVEALLTQLALEKFNVTSLQTFITMNINTYYYLTCSFQFI